MPDLTYLTKPIGEPQQSSPIPISNLAVKDDRPVYYGEPNFKPATIHDLDVSKYEPYVGQVNPSIMLDELRARNQPWYEQMGNGLAKMSGLAATTFTESFTDLLYGIPSAIIKGANRGDFRFSDIGNNEITNAFDSLNKTMEELFPNYYTQSEMDASILGNMFGYGAGNWWGDKFLKNTGFTVGAIGAAMLTSGAGAYALGITKGTKIANAAVKGLIEGEATLARAADLYKAGKLTADAYKAFKNSYNYIQVANKVNTGFSAFLGASTEAFIEARQGMNDYIDRRTQEIKEMHGRPPIEKEYDDIRAEAETLANIRYAMNLPLLLASNVVQFGKALSRNIIKDTDNLLSSNIIEQTTGRRLSDLTGKEVLDGTFALRRSKLNDVVKKTVTALKSPLMEGFEEIEQYHIERTLQDYFDKRSNAVDRKTAANFIDSFTKGFQEAYGSKEGIEQALIGALTGAMGMPNVKGISNKVKGAKGDTSIWAGGLIDGIQEVNKTIAREKAFVDQLNNKDDIKKFVNYFDNFTQTLANNKDYDEAINRGDHFTADIIKSDDFISHVLNNIENDSVDVLQTKLQAMHNMGIEDFKSFTGRKPDDPITLHEKNLMIESLTNKVNKINDLKKMVDIRFSDANSVAKISDTEALDIKNLFIRSASLLDETQNKENEINDKISLLSGGNLIYDDIKHLVGRYTDFNLLADRMLSSIDDNEAKKEVGKILAKTLKQISDSGITITNKELKDELLKRTKDTVDDRNLNFIINTVDSYRKREEENSEFRKAAEQKLSQVTDPIAKKEIEKLLTNSADIRNRRIQFENLYNFLDKGIRSETIDQLAKVITAKKESIAQQHQDIVDSVNEVTETPTDIVNNKKKKSNKKTKSEKSVTTEEFFNSFTDSKKEYSNEDSRILRDILDQAFEATTELYKGIRVLNDIGKAEIGDFLKTVADSYGLAEQALDKTKDADQKRYIQNYIDTVIEYQPLFNGITTKEKVDNNTKHHNTKKHEEELKKRVDEFIEVLAPPVAENPADKMASNVKKLAELLDFAADDIAKSKSTTVTELNKLPIEDYFTAVITFIDKIHPLSEEKFDKFANVFGYLKNGRVKMTFNQFENITGNNNINPTDIENGGNANDKLDEQSNTIDDTLNKGEEDSTKTFNYRRSLIGHNLIAYLSRKYERREDLIKGIVEIEDTENDLNNNSIPLDPDYIKEGMKVIIEPAKDTEFNEYIDDNGKTVTLQDLTEVGNFPIVVKTTDNKIIGYVHDINWINEYNLYSTPEAMNTDKQKLMEIRKFIRDNGAVETTISKKSFGVLIKNKDKKKQKVKDAFKNPDLKITVAKNNRLIFRNNIEFLQEDMKLLNEKDFIDGATYLPLYVGTREGKKHYIAIPVTNTKVSDIQAESIINAIKLYLNKDNEQLLKELQNKGFDIANKLDGLIKFVSQYVYNFNNVNLIGKGNSLFDYLIKVPNSNYRAISITNFGIQFGKGESDFVNELKFDENGGVKSITIGNITKNKNSKDFDSFQNTFFTNLQNHLTEMYTRVERTNINTPTRVYTLTDNLEVAYERYNDYVKDNTETPFMDFEYRNEDINGDKVKYINTIQPKVEFNTEFKALVKPEDISEEDALSITDEMKLLRSEEYFSDDTNKLISIKIAEIELRRNKELQDKFGRNLEVVSSKQKSVISRNPELVKLTSDPIESNNRAQRVIDLYDEINSKYDAEIAALKPTEIKPAIPEDEWSIESEGDYESFSQSYPSFLLGVERESLNNAINTANNLINKCK